MTDTSTGSKAIYLRLLCHVLPYRRTFALGIAAMIVLGLTEPAIPAILEMVVSSFEQQALDGVPLHAALFLGVFFIRGLSSVLQESIEGHKVVKVFSDRAYETRRFADVANRVRRFTSRHCSGVL